MALSAPPPRARPFADAPKLIKFVPFDPATKMSEATVDGCGRWHAAHREGRLCRGHRPCAAVADGGGGGEGARREGF